MSPEIFTSYNRVKDAQALGAEYKGWRWTLVPVVALAVVGIIYAIVYAASGAKEATMLKEFYYLSCANYFLLGMVTGISDKYGYKSALD